MALDIKTQDQIKQALGEKAASLVLDGMLVGLGTGSTAAYFIKSLIKRVRAGLKITCVSSSNASSKLAHDGGIEVLDMSEVDSIDLVVDGADEVDPQKRLIKGKGGALLREKILAAASKQMVVIVDESKLVEELGRSGLPVEILPFGARATIAHLDKLGLKGKLRASSNTKDAFYITDNGNYIFDVTYPTLFSEPEKTHAAIIQIPGVIETGFFFNLASRLLIGYVNGNIELK